MKPFVDIHTHLQTDHETISIVGLHPWKVGVESLPSLSQIEAADALGEIGLDKACRVDFDLQISAFERQLDLAEATQKAVVLHVVKAYEEVLACLATRSLRAVIFHGFIGSAQLAERLLQRGYYLSFGARTFLSSKTRCALRHTPLEQLFIETDESPMPLDEIYEKVASERGVSVETLAEKVYENYIKLFGR